MSNNDNENLTLRDKLAAAALPALIQRFNDKVPTKWVVEGEVTKEFDNDIEIISLLSYKFADAMRKSRLKSFT